jgi:hypothetical protein
MSDTASNADPEKPTLEEICADMTAEHRYEKFKRMLHLRGMTIDRLSQLATKNEHSRTHVILVLQGRRNGKHTWKRLVDFLERDELIVLGKKDLIVVPDTIKSST